MEKCLEVAKLLGEENVSRLKDTVTDLLIKRCEDELEDMSIYMIDYENLFEEIEDEVKAIVKDRIKQMYLEKADAKISKLFEKEIVL
jgi:hypothetical protein